MLELTNGPGIHVIKGTPEHDCRMWHHPEGPHPSGPRRRQDLPNPRGRTAEKQTNATSKQHHRSQEQTGLTKRREMQQPTFFDKRCNATHTGSGCSRTFCHCSSDDEDEVSVQLDSARPGLAHIRLLAHHLQVASGRSEENRASDAHTR